MNRVRLRSFSAGTGALLAGPAMADTLPVRHGAYVAVGRDCEPPPSVALRTYDGAGLGISKASDCRTRVASRPGDVFEIEQSCRRYGGPDLGRASVRPSASTDQPLSPTSRAAGPRAIASVPD